MASLSWCGMQTLILMTGDQALFVAGLSLHMHSPPPPPYTPAHISHSYPLSTLGFLPLDLPLAHCLRLELEHLSAWALSA